MGKSITNDTRNAIFDALIFITRSFAIPKQVILDAADAAIKVIADYLKQSSG